MKLSLVIPCKDKNDPKLKELLASIDAQDFPKSEMEVLVITNGTSESAKAIGIRRAKGEVIGILASDNELIGKHFLREFYQFTNDFGSSYPARYYYLKDDNILNRYFSLIGGNDPLSFYMGKNDKSSYLACDYNSNGTVGDNGFFIKKSLIELTDLENYYHIDNALEASGNRTVIFGYDIWHKTGGNIFSFFKKRYRYGLQHAFNSNRRWHLVEKTPRDIGRLIWFIICSLSLLQPLTVSVRGWLKIRDIAWFLHPIVAFLTCITYAVLMIHVGIRHLFRLLSAPMVALKA